MSLGPKQLSQWLEGQGTGARGTGVKVGAGAGTGTGVKVGAGAGVGVTYHRCKLQQGLKHLSCSIGGLFPLDNICNIRNKVNTLEAITTVPQPVLKKSNQKQL